MGKVPQVWMAAAVRTSLRRVDELEKCSDDLRTYQHVAGDGHASCSGPSGAVRGMGHSVVSSLLKVAYHREQRQQQHHSLLDGLVRKLDAVWSSSSFAERQAELEREVMQIRLQQQHQRVILRNLGTSFIPCLGVYVRHSPVD